MRTRLVSLLLAATGSVLLMATSNQLTRNVAAVIFPVDAERETGFHRYSNEDVARIAAENADILIPFASIDPAKGKAGAREARRLVREFGVRGFKFHPTMQGFFPNDRAACYTVLEACAEEGVITLFHTGQTGVGSGMRCAKGWCLPPPAPRCAACCSRWHSIF